MTDPSKKAIRLSAVLGAVGGAALTLATSVASPLIVKAIDPPAVSPPVVNESGCDNLSSTAVDGLERLSIFVSERGEDCWQLGLEGVNPGDEFDVLVSYQNLTYDDVEDVKILAALPAGIDYVPNSGDWYNASHQDGTPITGNLFKGGVNVGPYARSANAWIIFTARMSTSFDISCGLAVTPISATLRSASDEWSSAGLVTYEHCSDG